MQVDGCENVCNFGTGDIKFRQQFHFSTSNSRIDPKFPGHRNKIFLEDLE